MAAHEASSLYRYSPGSQPVKEHLPDSMCVLSFCSSSEEKAKLLRDVVAKIDSKNETLE